MSDHPIIFSAPMIRALLDGRKTQTRRVLKPQPLMDPKIAELPPGCLRYAPGDRLWVREAWCVRSEFDHLTPRQIETEEATKSAIGVFYHVDLSPPPYIGLGRWRPSIHMPRWASRITLTVTDVRVQRLQDISEADAVAEGVWDADEKPETYGPRAGFAAFRMLWNSIHGDDAWDANPWVAAYTFTVARGNIDSLGGADE